MKQYMEGALPNALLEAAKIDGAGYFRIFCSHNKRLAGSDRHNPDTAVPSRHKHLLKNRQADHAFSLRIRVQEPEKADADIWQRMMFPAACIYPNSTYMSQVHDTVS